MSIIPILLYKEMMIIYKCCNSLPLLCNFSIFSDLSCPTFSTWLLGNTNCYAIPSYVVHLILDSFVICLSVPFTVAPSQTTTHFFCHVKDVLPSDFSMFHAFNFFSLPLLMYVPSHPIPILSSKLLIKLTVIHM